MFHPVDITNIWNAPKQDLLNMTGKIKKSFNVFMMKWGGTYGSKRIAGTLKAQ